MVSQNYREVLINKVGGNKKYIQHIQSVLISKEKYPKLEDAEKKVLELGYQLKKVDDAKHFWRFRQMDPDKCNKYQTISQKDGVLEIFCYGHKKQDQ